MYIFVEAILATEFGCCYATNHVLDRKLLLENQKNIEILRVAKFSKIVSGNTKFIEIFQYICFRYFTRILLTLQVIKDRISSKK